jgi:hypothetical protein
MNQLVAFTDRAPALIAAAGARASYRFLLGGIAALRRRGPGPVPGGRSEGRRPKFNFMFLFSFFKMSMLISDRLGYRSDTGLSTSRFRASLKALL